MAVAMLIDMKTTISVSRQTRDQLASIAEREMPGATMDEALRVILFQHETSLAVARLEADPGALADYQDEMIKLADADPVIYE